MRTVAPPGLGAQLLGRPLESVPVPGDQGKARALRSEAAREFEPEPGRAAGDHDALIAKIEHGVPPLRNQSVCAPQSRNGKSQKQSLALHEPQDLIGPPRSDGPSASTASTSHLDALSARSARRCGCMYFGRDYLGLDSTHQIDEGPRRR